MQSPPFPRYLVPPRSKYSPQQLDTLISQIYLWNKTLHVSDRSSVHHQEFFTVHTATEISQIGKITGVCVREH